MNKIAILFMCLILLMTAAVGTTLAFFTDTESSAVSTITAGSVSMEMNVESNESVTVPAGTDDLSEQAATTLVLDKPIPTAPYVTNTGESDIYVRVRILVHEDAVPYFEVRMPTANAEATVSEAAETETEASNTNDLGFVYVQANDPQKYRRSTLDQNKDYVEYLFVYTEPLKPGDVTANSVAECFYFKRPDAVTASDSEPNLNVSFHADAIQASTFDNAMDAFENFDRVPLDTASETETAVTEP